MKNCATVIMRVGKSPAQWLLCEECRVELRGKYPTFLVEEIDLSDHEDCERCINRTDFDEALRNEGPV